MTITANVAANRAVIAAKGISGGQVVRARQFSDALALYHWCLGRGATVVPAYSPEDVTISAGGTATFNFYTKPRTQTIARVWFVWARSSTATEVSSYSIAAPTGATALTFPAPFTRATAPVAFVETIAQGSTAAAITLDIAAITGDVIVDSIACYDLPRASLLEDATDLGINTLGFLPARPIWSDSSATPQGFARLAGTLSNDANIGRRIGHFAWSVPDTSAVTTTSSSYSPAIRLPVPMMCRALTLNSTTGLPPTTAALTLAVRFKTNDGTSTASVQAVGSTTGTVTRTSTSFGWVTTTFTMPTHDMTTADGRRSAAWSTCVLQFKAGTAGKETAVSAISIYEA